MKKIITLYCLGISLLSCAQKEIKLEDVMNQEFIENTKDIYTTVKIYDYNPSYTLHMEQAAGFSFEILVNGIPAYIHFEKGSISGSKPINDYLFTSGKQDLQVRMYPKVDDDYNMDKTIDMEQITLELSINYGEYGKEKVAQFKEPFRFSLPKTTGKLPYYEVNLTFDATIPYGNDVVGWGKSVDLSKENQEQLRQEVEAFYKNLILNYEKKDVNQLAKTYYKRQKSIMQSYYLAEPKYYEEVISGWLDDVNETAPFIFNDYIMRLYANGKIVALVKTDKYYLNMSTLMREDEEEKYSMYPLYLHRPTPGAPLEVLR